VLPEVYGGRAPLIPVEEAVAARMCAQQRAARKGPGGAAGEPGRAAGGAGAKSGRLAAAGHAVARWSSSAWNLLKKPAQARAPRGALSLFLLPFLACQDSGGQPAVSGSRMRVVRSSCAAPCAQAVSSSSRKWHWPRLPRISLSRHSHAQRAAKKAAAKFRAEAQLRQKRQRPAAGGGRPQGRSLLLRMLAPQFLLEVLRILTQSAAQVRARTPVPLFASLRLRFLPLRPLLVQHA
jgi:hypothetical protein